jgi:catechol 2,3-dioxygenase-like lactoylglutathione lyase family enzyme
MTKRVVRAFAVFAVLAVSLASLPPAPGGERMRVAAVEGVAITVGDLDRAIAFYTSVLAFELTERADTPGLPDVPDGRVRLARLRLGDERVELMEYASPKGRGVPSESRSNDLWFQHIAIVVADMERAFARLSAHGVVRVSAAPQRLPDWNPSAGGITAFYFRDPDGHVLELIDFPPDKGLAKWRRPTDRLFLGIDHTAIAVADTARSLGFYRDALGLRIAGESENRGPEQARLNDVPGAHLRITALRAPEGPGIELLEYLAPRDGRRLPWQPRSNDLVHWHTILAGAGREGGLVRDPDGHALLLR